MGCGASAAKDAPNLKQYFVCMEKMLDSTGELDAMELMMDPAKLEQVEKDSQKVIEECKEWASKSFDHHDKDNSGHLDVAEAKRLFGNYVTLYIKFHEKNDVKLVKSQMAQALKLMAPMLEMLGADAKKELKQQEKAAIAEIHKKMKEKRENYMSNRDTMDEEAFKTLDCSKDGKVQKKDFVDSLTPQTDIYNRMHLALGLMDAAELAAEMKSAMGPDEGCPQQ
eukprot:TRINITY_DN2081_c0_g1_i1.p1 TRINITY_DN2081_c0_g1~~TRINITY_DN2081_c0_g1_i1.p1  ORF type:complete len:224 (+),score=73.39 TRINITY_DN2081_c0_g1_i1:67-738(+)